MKKTLFEFCEENNKSELLSEWDEEANGDLSPKAITYGSGKKVWWRCKKGHTWQASVNSRSHGCGCPVCSGKVVISGDNDIESQLPELALQWNYEKNAPLTPALVTKGSHRLVWWRCEKGHEWRAAVNSRAMGAGCPVCAGRKLLIGENDLMSVRPDLAEEWHPRKNGTLTPDKVIYTATQRVWWMCKYGHEWQAKVKDRMDGTGCPVCGGKRAVKGVNDLESGYPAVAAQWHPVKNGTLAPSEVTVSSNRRVWWSCEYGHEWQTSVYSRTQEMTQCPYCTNRKVLAGFNDLASTEPEIAAQWHPTLNGTLTPQQVTAGSRKRAWWICSEGHIWKTVIYARTGKKKTNCPFCTGNVKKRKRGIYTR